MRILPGVAAICLFAISVFTTSARADDLAIRYEILGIQNGPERATLTLKLQLINLTGADLNQVSLEILTVMSSVASREGISISRLAANPPQTMTVNLSIPPEFLPQQDDAYSFLVSYPNAEGEAVTAIIQGHRSVISGDVAP